MTAEPESGRHERDDDANGTPGQRLGSDVSPFGESDAPVHHCLIYQRIQELDEVFRRFVDEGLRLERRVLVIGEPGLLKRLGSVVPWPRPSLDGRRLDPIRFQDSSACWMGAKNTDRYKAISFLRDQMRLAIEDGFEGLHVVREVGVIAEGTPGVREGVALEAGLNVILSAQRCAVLCLYDSGRAPPGLILTGLDLHPTRMEGGVYRPSANPFYRPGTELSGRWTKETADERLRVLERLREAEGSRVTAEPVFRGVVDWVEGRGGSLEAALGVAVEAVGARLGAVAGRAHLVDLASDLLVPFRQWRPLVEGALPTEAFDRSDAEPGVARGQGIVGAAWLRRRPTWDVGIGTRTEGATGSAAMAPARVAIPLEGGGTVRAVIEFAFAESREPDEEALEDLEATARILGEMVLRIQAEEQLHQARARLGALVDDIGDGVVVTDEAGRIRSWNARAARILGHEGEEVPIGRPIQDYVATELAEPLRRAMATASSGVGSAAVGGCVQLYFPRIIHGGPAVSVTITSLDFDRPPSFVFVLSRPSLALAAQDVDAIGTPQPFHQWPEPLLIVSGDARWGGPTIVSASRVFCRMTGFTESELRGRSFSSLLGTRPDGETVEGVRRGFASGEVFSTELAVPRRGGEPFPMRLEIMPVQDATGALSHFVARLSEPVRTEAMADVIKRAETDPLTGLANRPFFDKHLRRAIDRTRKNPDLHYGVLFLDLDGFKEVNDEYGHLTGDRLLRAVARQIEAAVRPEDIVARFGGDEFVILLDLIGGVKEATAVAGRIRERFAEPIEIQGETFKVSASVGIAMSDTGYDSVERVLRDADAAMYHAKREGTGGHRIFDPTLRAAEAAAERIREALRRSLERDEFRLHYQPLVDLVSNRIAGMEAFLRWEHPERGTLAAAEFISEAEDVGLILPIGRWVIREACRQLAAWREQLGADLAVVLNVNLSSRELSDPSLPDWIRKNLREFNTPPSSLRLEIPESYLSRRGSTAAELLDSLHELGVRIGIGDFGGGHSSISNLSQSPVDLLKIGRHFLAPAGVGDESPEGSVDERAVSSVLAFAKSLGIRVVAAGVETPLQRETLRRLSCPTAQGYLFSAPVEAEGVRDLLRETWGAGGAPAPTFA